MIKSLLRGAMSREGASSPPVPPLPLDTPSEVERRERRLIHIKGGQCYNNERVALNTQTETK